jgi:hypothetical protein
MLINLNVLLPVNVFPQPTTNVLELAAVNLNYLPSARLLAREVLGRTRVVSLKPISLNVDLT